MHTAAADEHRDLAGVLASTDPQLFNLAPPNPSTGRGTMIAERCDTCYQEIARQ